MQEYIIGNIVRPEDRRDVYGDMALATGFRGYVRNITHEGDEPQIGEHSAYVQELSEEQVEEIRARVEAGEIGNLRYIEPNGTVTTDELEVAKLGTPFGELGEDVGPGAAPEAASLKYMGADGLTEDGWDGTGVRVAVGDGGTSRKWREVTGIVPKKTFDFVSNLTQTHLQVEAGGTEHGCYVAPHCVPVDAEYYEAVVFNGEGSASWADVARFFRWCGDNEVDVANFSGSGDGLSRAVQDAVDYAVARGVAITSSMGNDGRHTFNITPAGLRDLYSSGSADQRIDRRSGFSTHHEKMSGLAPGDRVISFNAEGNSLSGAVLLARLRTRLA